jgi:hypothetical protein
MDTLLPMTPLESWLLIVAIFGLVSSFVYYLRWKELKRADERKERFAWTRLAENELQIVRRANGRASDIESPIN